MFLANTIMELVRSTKKDTTSIFDQAAKSALKAGYRAMGNQELAAHQAGEVILRLQKTSLPYLGKLARTLPKSMRFSLEHSIRDAIAKAHPKYSMGSFLKAFNSIKLPHNPTWIEWKTDACAGGYLITEEEYRGAKSLKIEHVISSNTLKVPVGSPDLAFRVTESSCDFVGENVAQATREHVDIEHQVKTVLLTLLMMNSRKKDNDFNVIQVGQETEDSGIPIKGRRENSTMLQRALKLRPIVFDTTRTVTNSDSKEDQEKERRLRYITVRMGNFALYSYGLVWRNFHNVRITADIDDDHLASIDSEEPIMKDRLLIKGNENTDLETLDSKFHFPSNDPL